MPQFSTASNERREGEKRKKPFSETESKDPVDVACRRLMMQFGENGEQKKKAFSSIEEISFLCLLEHSQFLALFFSIWPF